MKTNKFTKKITRIKSIILTLIISGIISGCGSTFEQKKSAPIILYSEQDSNNKPQNKKNKTIIHKQINNKTHIQPKIYFHQLKTHKLKTHKNTHKSKKPNKINSNKNKKTKFLFKNKSLNYHKTTKWLPPTKGKHHENKLITYFSGKPNQDIYASSNGTVMFSGEGVKPFKNMIIISKDKSISTVYGNLSKINIKEGQHIKQGIKIGNMGLSSNKKHGSLLFQIRKNGTPIKYSSFFN
jgi:murein DD-endopeptidase MepM/ murein hydrolase activator NlpD